LYVHFHEILDKSISSYGEVLIRHSDNLDLSVPCGIVQKQCILQI